MRRKTSVEDFEALFGAAKRTGVNEDEIDDAMPIFGEDLEKTSEETDKDDDQATMILEPLMLGVPIVQSESSEQTETEQTDAAADTAEEEDEASSPEEELSDAEVPEAETEISDAEAGESEAVIPETSDAEVDDMKMAEPETVGNGAEDMAAEENDTAEDGDAEEDDEKDEKIQPINEEIAMFFAEEINEPTATVHLTELTHTDREEPKISVESPEEDDISETEKEDMSEVQKLLDHEAAQDLMAMEEADARYKEKRKKKKKKKKKNKHIIGKCLSFVQAIISVVTLAVLAYYDLVPERYLILGGAALGGLFVLTFAMQYKRGLHILGKLISLLLSAVMVIGIVYLGKTMSTLDTVTTVKNYQTDKIAFAVLADSKYETIEDVLGESFGIMTAMDKTKIDQAIGQIEEKHNATIKKKEYSSYTDLVNDLYSGKIKVIAYNQAMSELIADQNEGFLEKIKVLETESVQTEVLMDDVPDLPVTTEPFIVYLSGLDVYDGMDEASRSDVNIMACVNPVSKQILLVSVPRDAYVSIPGITGEGGRDKLTHAGMYGVNYSIAAMENIFDVDINYYGRINFTAFLKMVDALGGVDVDSDYAFSTYYKQYDPDTNIWEYFYYDKGINHLDGRHALAFARERMNSAIGDYQRARNQEKVISALVAKLQSPAVLTGYTDLLASMEGHVDTNLTSQQLASLVKMQLNDGAHWNIVMSSVYGSASSEYCASYSEEPLDVEILDEESIQAVKEVIADLLAGKVIGEPRKTQIQDTYTMTESDANSDYYLHQHASDEEYDEFYWQNGGADADGTANAPEAVKRKQQEMQEQQQQEQQQEEQQQEEAPPAEEEYQEEYYE